MLRNFMGLIRSLRPAGVWAWLHSSAGVRFIRFAGVSALALITSLVTVAVCDAVFHLTSGPTALISQVTGAIVSYALSRLAWERKGRPDLLRETLPFWAAFGVATLISWGFTKLGYFSAGQMHLHGWKSVAVIEGIYFIGNVVTFLMRFVFFHYVLFTDRTARVRPAGVAAAEELVKSTGPMRAVAVAEPQEPAEAVEPQRPAEPVFGAQPSQGR
jgi:putative flippase GtrA